MSNNPVMTMKQKFRLLKIAIEVYRKMQNKKDWTINNVYQALFLELTHDPDASASGEIVPGLCRDCPGLAHRAQHRPAGLK